MKNFFTPAPGRLFSGFTVWAFVLLCGTLACLHFAGCEAAKGPPPSTSGLDTANKGIGAVTADARQIQKQTTAAIPHADATGKELLTQTTSTTADLIEQAGVTEKGMQDDKTEAAKALSDQIAKDSAEKKQAVADQAATDKLAQAAAVKSAQEKAYNDSHGPAVAALWCFVIAGLLGFVGGMIFKGVVTLTATKAIGETIAMGGFLLCVASLALIFGIAVMTALTPVIVLVVGGILITAGTALAIVTFREIMAKKAAIGELIDDSLGSKQPTVPYTPKTEAIVKAIAGTAAAKPEPKPVMAAVNTATGEVVGTVQKLV